MKTHIAVLLVGAAVYVRAGTVAERLAVPVLPGQEMASHNLVYEQLREKDIEADRAFAECRKPAAFKARQAEIHKRWVDSFGGFPERTPLNTVFGGTVQRDGYTVTKVRYESQPGHTVTALLYRPDSPKCRPPHPCILIPCGHSLEGKAALAYQRAGVVAAQAGFIALCYDPISQGERIELSNDVWGTTAHDVIGARAILLGWNTARFRIWDGIRSIDFLEALPDADIMRLGVMGNSGGGTLASYLMCADARIKAAAPSCFITNLRDHCALTGPHDAEQNFFGQLDYGLNHTAFLLLRAPELPVCVNAVHDDFFPFAGTQATLAAATQALAVLGLKAPDLSRPAFNAPLALIDVPGTHGWKEGHLQGSVAWMRAKLMGDKRVLPFDIATLREISAAPISREGLLTERETFCTPTGSVFQENHGGLTRPEVRTTFDLMRDELMSIDRVALTDRHRGRDTRDLATTWQAIGQKAAIGKTLKFDHFPVGKAPVETLSETMLDDGMREVRQVLRVNHGEGMTSAVPMIAFIPKDAKGKPALLLAQGGKSSWTNEVGVATGLSSTPVLFSKGSNPLPLLTNEVTRLLQDGSPVVVMDVFGTGEVGQIRKGTKQGHTIYNFGGKDTNENAAMMLYLLGRSMIEFQTREILAAVAAVSETFKERVNLYAEADDLAIATHHAWAYDAFGHIHALFYRGCTTYKFSRSVEGEKDVFKALLVKATKWDECTKDWERQDEGSQGDPFEGSFKKGSYEYGFPLSWREAIRLNGGEPRLLFSHTVHGALRYYDWTELSPFRASQR
ncbi:MAG: hypothetical protein FWG50_00530 [Kiritimatiellaeota bacterium]|nr:hypothetical protein [Kiritimatiellota bacterium]